MFFILALSEDIVLYFSIKTLHINQKQKNKKKLLTKNKKTL